MTIEYLFIGCGVQVTDNIFHHLVASFGYSDSGILGHYRGARLIVPRFWNYKIEHISGFLSIELLREFSNWRT